jgi:Holliday junction resolvase
MNRSKRKGTAGESAVVAWLRDQGWLAAERRALTGAADQGDIAGLPGVVIEVKNTAKVDLAGWLAELEAEISNAKADTGFVIAKRRGSTDVGQWYAILPAGRLAALLKDAGR